MNTTESFGVSADAFTRGKRLLKTIVKKMPRINKWQRKFLSEIFLLCLGLNGRFNFLQMGREGNYHEQTYRNQFSKPFDFMQMNKEMIKTVGSGEYILAFDPTYIKKSGKQTPGVGYFYSGCSAQYERGLELGGLAAIDVKQRTAYHLEAVQSPSKDGVKGQQGSLVDHYAGVIIEKAERAESISQILAVDGYFAKKNFINPVCEQTNLTIVSLLRRDADLRYLYSGPARKGRGRPKQYDGKVDVGNIDKRRIRLEYSDDELNIYGACLNSKSLKRNIKVAYTEFKNNDGKVVTTKMFFSTDLQMSVVDIVRYYRLRFQIEFLYRDAKQYTGLEHCQARCSQKLHFHFNTSLTSVSLGKILLRQNCKRDEPISLSIANIKTELSNRNMVYRIFSMYGLNPYLIKNNSKYRRLLNFGKRAA